MSTDYVFCRTDKPQGATYNFNPTITPDKEEMRRFIEMCFDPASPMNEKLKGTLFQMMEGYAEYYSAELSEKIQRGQKDNALKAATLRWAMWWGTMAFWQSTR